MNAAKISPETLFSEVAQFVANGRELLARGAMMELKGLDHEVHTLCQSILQLSPEERARYAAQLEQLLAEVSALGDALAAERDAIAGEIRQLATHKKANVAYLTTEARAPSKKKDER